MSLHTLANNLQRAGRGDDKMLVHMTPREVGGLQALAMAHGGSLSINPQTGLPEAGILGKLLPTVLGFALGPAGFGVMSATQAGIASGLVGTLATGSLGKGIMAGLGAYGGASLGQSLMGAGGGGGFNPLAGATTEQMAQAFGKAPPSLPPGLAAVNQGGFATPPINVAQQAAKLAPTNLAQQSVANAPQGISSTPAPVTPIKDIKLSQAPDLETIKGRMSAVGEGLKNITASPESLFAFAKENPAALAAIATSASSDMFAGPPKEREKSKGMEKYRYVYDRQPIGVAASRSAERDYFPGARYEPTGEYYAASGGLMALADGGTVEQMSRLNAIGANTGYPMANQMSSTYATPAERPISENIIRPQGDANIDPYTGEQKFADGGYTQPQEYRRYYGQGKPPGEDYYYVSGGMAPSYYMYRPAGGADADSASGVSNFFDPSYFNPKTGTYGTTTAAAPKLGTEAVEQTRETLEPMYQKYFGRGIDEAGLAAYTARPFSEAELDKIFTGSEEYKPIAAAKAAAAKEASYATPEQGADIYERIMGRQPDIGGLEYYTKTNRMTPEEMEKSLRGSEEYFRNLTKPFVPAITYGDTGRASIEGAPKYDPSQYGFAAGGLSDLGAYSDGGRLLKGPGDGVSDSIPAVIGERQPARLADGEFVVPARIVSELGNGSTDAGARKLYAMMERIQSARKKSVGKGRVATNTKSEKYLPA